MASERYLALSEAIYVPTDITCVATAVIEGPLGEADERAFRQAYQALARGGAPLLGGRIETDDRGLRFVVPDDAPLTVVVRADGDAGYAEEAHKPLASATELSRLLIVRGTERSYVALVLHHAIADGHAAVGLFTALWQTYVAAVSGTLTSGGPAAELPASMEQVLAKRFGYPEPGVVPGGLLPIGGAPAAPSSAFRIRLTAQETKALSVAARQERTWPHAYVCGALLLALREATGRPDPVRLSCASAVDLRNRVSPPIELGESTTFTGGHHADLDVSAGDKAVDLGREVLTRLEETITHKGWKSLVMDLTVAQMDVESHPLVVVSNLGTVPKLTSPTGLVVSDVRMFGNTSQPQPVYFADIYDGRLSIEISYSPDDTYTEAYWERFGATVRENLRTA